MHRTTCCVSDNCLRFHTLLDLHLQTDANASKPAPQLARTSGKPWFPPARIAGGRALRPIFRGTCRSCVSSCLVLSRPVVASSSPRRSPPARLAARSELSLSAGFIQPACRVHTTRACVSANGGRSESTPSAAPPVWRLVFARCGRRRPSVANRFQRAEIIAKHTPRLHSSRSCAARRGRRSARR